MVDEIIANTGWPLKISPQISTVPAPTPAELAALRRVDTTGMLRRD